jgi:anti-sigma factor RsiW
MTKTSLSNLYRRLTANRAAMSLGSDDLAAAADGSLNADRRDPVAEALAASPAEAGLVRMLRALKNESQALAANVARTQRETTHRRHQRDAGRVAAGRRFGGTARWATAMAACLVAVVGIWTQRHLQTQHAGAQSTHAVARSDVIFSSRDTIFDGGMDKSKHNARSDNDRVFRGSFSDG